jgi:enoyl-CoA hydratase/carnithine racemase
LSYETLLYDVDDAVATITLNRPERLNAISPPMPFELEAAVHAAVADEAVKVIVLRGAGRAFCAGFDFSGGFRQYAEHLETDGEWDPGKDMTYVTAPSLAPVPKFMSLWRSPKPVIAQVHGWCVGGGSDMALCADLVIASEDARIGTPYSRAWGCYLTGMWIYRLGLAKAKEHALTGRPLSGIEAAEAELINAAVPFERLSDEVAERARQLASLPAGQLAAMKLIVNQAYENMGLASTQLLGPILDGSMRNIPEGKRFVEEAERDGVPAVVARRDAPFGDYAATPPRPIAKPVERPEATPIDRGRYSWDITIVSPNVPTIEMPASASATAPTTPPTTTKTRISGPAAPSDTTSTGRRPIRSAAGPTRIVPIPPTSSISVSRWLPYASECPSETSQRGTNVSSPNHARLRKPMIASSSASAPGLFSPAACRSTERSGTNVRRNGVSASSIPAIARHGSMTSSPPRSPNHTTSDVATSGPSAKPTLPPIENALIPLARLWPLAYAATFDPSGWYAATPSPETTTSANTTQ